MEATTSMDPAAQAQALKLESMAQLDRQEEPGALPAVVRAKLADAETPGFAAEFDPEEAAAIGAFEEDALTENDARESANDDRG